MSNLAGLPLLPLVSGGVGTLSTARSSVGGVDAVFLATGADRQLLAALPEMVVDVDMLGAELSLRSVQPLTSSKQAFFIAVRRDMLAVTGVLGFHKSREPFCEMIPGSTPSMREDKPDIPAMVPVFLSAINHNQQAAPRHYNLGHRTPSGWRPRRSTAC